MSTDILEDLRSRKKTKPFERFAFVLNDGRTLPVEGRFRFAFNLNEIIVIDDNDAINHFKHQQVSRIETLNPAK